MDPLFTTEKKNPQSPLSKPLIDDKNSVPQAMSQPRISTQSNKTTSNKQVENYLAGRIYASNAPKILLETITARTALLIIALTYIFFIIGFALDFNTTYQGFNGSNKLIPALSCESQNLTLSSKETFWGCSNGRYWNSTVTHLTNVLSVKLNVQQTNLTSLLSTMNSTFNIEYNVQIWACYDEGGCGVNFALNDAYSDDPNLWQQMLTLSNQFVEINPDRDVYTVDDTPALNLQLVSNTFQNQESIPTNGLVKSYYMLVEYLQDPYNLFSGTMTDSSTINTLYYFDVVSRPKDVVVDALTIILMALTMAVLGLYSYVLLRQDKILSEQKWVIAYFVLLILFQNPNYCVIVWYTSPPTVVAAYASYVIGYLAQSGLFILWLLFADSIQRKTNSKTIFYAPKIFIGLVIFTTGIVILTFQFPGLDPTGNSQRNAVEAVTNWSSGLKSNFIFFTILYIVLIWVWTVMWFVRLIVTGRRLNKLPYMSTRYIQLSYRFFFLQATLVTVYYVCQYGAVVYFISSGNTAHDSYDPTSLTDNINTLFRQQTQLFGKTLFLTVYAIIIAFLFLPANLSDNTGIVASLAATYVITETEHTSLVASRLTGIKNMNRNLLNKVTRMNQLIHAQSDVFCVDIALNLRNIAFQAYYDPPVVRTLSGYDGVMDVERVGYTLIECHYNPAHEVFCFIVREKKTGRLVVAFRGTASKRQMEDNLNFTQKAVDFSELSTATLNHMDGLSIKKEESDEFADDDLDSVDEEDLNEEDNYLQNDVESGFLFARHSTSSDVGANSHNNNNNNNAQEGGEGGIRETIMERSTALVEGVRSVFAGAVDVTNNTIDAVVGLSAGVAVGVASKTPGLKSIVKQHVHSGFWEAYSHVRDFVHAILRRELIKAPTTVFFTGHSLGGALATYAALDFSIHTVPRVNAYLKHKERQLYGSSVAAREAPTILSTLRNIAHLPQSNSVNARDFHKNNTPANTPGHGNQQQIHSDEGRTQSASRVLSDNSAPFLHSNSRSVSKRGENAPRPKFVKKIKVVMYNFGSPRVGNSAFASMYDKEVPKSYRVVVDGDVVTGLPPSGYQHIGTEILIDSTGSGSIIIDPSFVERWLRTHTKSSVAAHSLLVYRKGLLGIKLSAEFMKQRAVDYAKQDLDADPLRLALKVRGSIHVESVLDYDYHQSHLEEEEEQERLTILSQSEKKRPPPVSFVDATNNDELRMSNNGDRSDSTCIELKPSPTGSASSILLVGSPELLSPLSRMATEKLTLTADEAKLVNNSQESAANTEQEDALHYAHDVETMESLVSGMQGLKKTGPVKWLKNKTINRMKSSKSGKHHIFASSPSSSLNNSNISPIAAMTSGETTSGARSNSRDVTQQEGHSGGGYIAPNFKSGSSADSRDDPHNESMNPLNSSSGDNQDQFNSNPPVSSITGKRVTPKAGEKKTSAKRANELLSGAGRSESPAVINTEFTSLRKGSESD